MQKLTIGNFTREGSQGSFGHRFFKKLDDGREINLESCLEGYDVALYDQDSNLIGEKVCIKVKDMMRMQVMPGFSVATGDALQKAVDIANEMLKEK